MAATAGESETECRDRLLKELKREDLSEMFAMAKAITKMLGVAHKEELIGAIEAGQEKEFARCVELVSEAAQDFYGVDQETGNIFGAIAQSVLANLAGEEKKLGPIGKMVLDNVKAHNFYRQQEGTEKMPKCSRFLLERERCIQEECLFEDPAFAASNDSLYQFLGPPDYVQWLRPGDIADAPQFFVDGHSRFDVCQGQLGDCWLLSAIATLTLNDRLFFNVVPPHQSFTEHYAGIFHFRFWYMGKWMDVVVDDRLPCKPSGEFICLANKERRGFWSPCELLYVHSKEGNEFWSALLEKAYAKLYDSYGALDGGQTGEALEDMTGGLVELYDLRIPLPRSLWKILGHGLDRGSLLTASILPGDDKKDEYVQKTGLITGHGYSVTHRCSLPTEGGAQVRLVRVRNPHGKTEWTGPWSDHAPEWDSVPREALHSKGPIFKKRNDGEFWMTYEDFVSYYDWLEICNLSPEMADGCGGEKYCWTTKVHTGNWRIKHSKFQFGGCSKYDTFADNPQYRIKLTKTDKSEADDPDGKCTVIVALMLLFRRNKSVSYDVAVVGQNGEDRTIENSKDATIGFVIYQSNGTSGRLDREFFDDAEFCEPLPEFKGLREVTARYRLDPGEYVIVPCTVEPDFPGDFMLRIFTDARIESKEYPSK